MDLIKVIKKDKVIIMTTHLMEEAEALSDRVMIMNKGEMLCIGTSLQIKHEFGTGYKIQI
jgi:ABC-type multidrug transport system ATPase subunit